MTNRTTKVLMYAGLLSLVVTAFILCYTTCCSTSGVVVKETPKDIFRGVKSLTDLRDGVVFVEVGDKLNWGSGWAFKSGDQIFVWTCAHVIAVAREKPNDFSAQHIKVHTKRIKDFKEADKFIVSEAEVIRASIDFDLALLHVKDKSFPVNDLIWDISDKPRPLGTKEILVGCPLGKEMWGTISFGQLSLHGRVVFDRCLDVTTAIGTHGSSGSGVFIDDPDLGYPCVGILVGGWERLPNAMSYVPARSVKDFVSLGKIEWAFDYNKVAPDLEFVKKMAPIEVDEPEEDSEEELEKAIENK